MKSILSDLEPGSLVICDIDDTLGRVSQTIGLDAWFRFRIEQFALEGYEPAESLSKAIEIYNLVQMASIKMVAVEEGLEIATIIKQLQRNNIKVIALTARNYVLAEKTLSLLETIGISFSEDVLVPDSFTFNNKRIEIRQGVIFANGSNKGGCLEQVSERGGFVNDLLTYKSCRFIDDSEKNCTAVAISLDRLGIHEYSVWHYRYAETYLAFTQLDQDRANIQEEYFRENNRLLTDEEADVILNATSIIRMAV